MITMELYCLGERESKQEDKEERERERERASLSLMDPIVFVCAHYQLSSSVSLLSSHVLA